VFQCAQSKATVVGLGATGLSLVRFLRARGADVTVVDGSSEPAGLAQLHREFPQVKFKSVNVATDTLPRSDFIALSPGVPRATLAISDALKHGIPVLGDIELFAREVPTSASVFAITGSNGKTTTTALAGELAKCAKPDARAAGNIGVPILDALAETPNCSTWVLELSSFQLESTDSLRLTSAAVINVTDNHLDRYPSFFGYAAAKERVYKHAASQVLNRADAWSMSMRRPTLNVTTFGPDQAEDDAQFGVDHVDGKAALMQGDMAILAADQLGVSGAHNAQNALAALALIQSLSVSLNLQQAVLRSFAGMPHRCQLIGTINGVKIIDDSKATTVVATNAALDGLAAPTWLIAGGDGKGQHFAALGAAAAKHCKAVHLIGRDAAEIATALAANGVPNKTFANLEDATRSALDEALPGDQILLSPACASWDMFRNYGHRAQVFAAAVSDWANKRGLDFVPRGVRA
jgi:UDP-N-acetylmuramoylalanine--D-glutamate ligase